MFRAVHRLAHLADARSAAGRGLVVHDHDRFAGMALVGGKFLFDGGRIDAVPPIATNELDDEPHAFGDLAPQRGEMASLEHQHLVAGRQRIDDGRFPRTRAGRRKYDDRMLRLENTFEAGKNLTTSAPNSGPRWSIVGLSIARKMRSGTLVGPGI